MSSAPFDPARVVTAIASAYMVTVFADTGRGGAMAPAVRAALDASCCAAGAHRGHAGGDRAAAHMGRRGGVESVA